MITLLKSAVGDVTIVAEEYGKDIFGKDMPSDLALLKGAVGGVKIVAEGDGATGSTSRAISPAVTPAAGKTIITALALKETATDKIGISLKRNPKW